MANIPVKLKNPVNSFSVFENNQVLTADQLNSVVSYFDYQQRLTRTKLLGAGIVCGLHIFFEKNNITVTKGVGLTSDGDLAVLENDILLTDVIALDDKKAKYKPFETIIGDGNSVAIWEALPLNSKVKDELTPLSSFFEEKNLASDFIVLIYLSQYEEDTDICSSDECDNKGIIQQSNLKFLLMKKTDYAKIAFNSPCCSENYFDLNDVSIPRVFLNENDSLFSYNDLRNAYTSVLNNVNTGGLSLSAALTKADGIAQGIFQCYASNGNIPFVNTRVIRNADIALTRLRIKNNFNAGAAFEQKLKELLADKGSNNIQYVYDFTKEIADAYNEFKESIFELCYSCCIDAEAFPKHLALGELVPADSFHTCAYRQCFIESPILNHKDGLLKTAMNLYTRIVTLINGFKFLSVRDAIKVTPSSGINKLLGNRAIPCYYNAQTVAPVWNDEKTRRNRINDIKSYDANGVKENGYSTLLQTINPLDYNMDDCGFFRIEGHIGREYKQALAAINSLRQTKDLPFEVVGVQLQTERKTITPIRDHIFPHFDILYNSHLIKWNTHLEHIKMNNVEVETKLPANTELAKDGITIKTDDLIKYRDEVKALRTQVDTHITETQNAMKTAPAGNTNFTELQNAMITKSANLGSKVKYFTGAGINTPLDNVVHNFNPHILDWLSDFKATTDNKTIDGYVFSNFLKQHPSMLHNAGVCKGGTFVLVYNTVNGVSTVVADFYLPYVCKELVNTTVKIDTVPPRPIKWVKDFNYLQLFNEPLYNPKVFDVKKDLDIYKVKNDGVGDGLTKKYNEVVSKYEDSFIKLSGSYEKVYTIPQRTLAAANANLLTKETALTMTKEEAALALKDIQASMANLKEIHGL
jgi:hypothetical protein